jgi:hypothetical protein
MDMELTLSRPHASSTHVTVSCDGAYSHDFDLCKLIPSKANQLPHPFDDAVKYGEALYAALFPQGNVAQQVLSGKPKRLLLVALDDSLDAIPWEYTYGPDEFLGCRCCIVRDLPVAERITPPEMLAGLHIIAVASNPLSQRLAPLNIQGEWTRLTEIVSEMDRSVTLERAWPPTIERLRDLVIDGPQRVVHFMGHGGHNAKDEAVLCFEQDNGAREDITAQEFVQRVQSNVFW